MKTQTNSISTKHPTRRNRAFVWLQYRLPQHALSRLMLRITRLQLGGLTHWLIRRFVDYFHVDLSQAAATSVTAYPSFNAFFTRALAANARPLPGNPRLITSPVDGVVSEAGVIAGDRLLQCKGQQFSLTTLLGKHTDLAAPLLGGLFATLYLSPRDYHRIHMPLPGRLTAMVHVPGRLFSVNPVTVAAVPELFARNERVVACFDTDIGPIAMVLVGAIFVGSIETHWAGVVTPPRGMQPVRIDYSANNAVEFARGDEMGRFNMGSTIILLLPPGTAEWSAGLRSGISVRCRSEIGRLLASVP